MGYELMNMYTIDFKLKLNLWKYVFLFTMLKYLYALLSYGIALWGNSPGDEKLFICQKSFISTIECFKYM